MSKRLTKEGWRALGVHNSHDLCVEGGVGVYVDYLGVERGRGGHGAAWRIIKPGEKTDPGGPWYNRGHKTFNVFHADKEPKRLEAIAWASKRYGVTEWERDPWGDYHPLGTMESARKSLEAAITLAPDKP